MTNFFLKRTIFVSKRTYFVSKGQILSQKDRFCLKRTDFVSKRTNFVSKKTNFVSKRTNFVSKRTYFVSKGHILSQKNKFCLKKDKFCLKKDAFCLKKDNLFLKKNNYKKMFDITNVGSPFWSGSVPWQVYLCNLKTYLLIYSVIYSIFIKSLNLMLNNLFRSLSIKDVNCWKNNKYFMHPIMKFIMKISKLYTFTTLQMALCENIFNVLNNLMLEMNNITMGWHAFRGWFFIIKVFKVLSKKLRIFSHFVRLVTDMCLVKFRPKKSEAYLYKPCKRSNVLLITN